VVFFKTIAPVEPVSFIHKICEDAMAEPMRKRTRTAKRLAPMTLMGKATMEGLESVARDVLAPHFHQAPVTPKKVSLMRSLRWFPLLCLQCSAVHFALVGGCFVFFWLEYAGMGRDGLCGAGAGDLPRLRCRQTAGAEADFQCSLP
jgi:hypothetical protein